MNYRPYWWDTVTDRDSSVVLPRSCDVVIIGAGYTGLSAARRLGQRGASVLVVDREGIGWGASSRNGGQVLTGLKIGPATLVARYGERRARELFEAANAAIANLAALIRDERIECGYRRSGHLQAAWKASHFTAFRGEQALLARVFMHRVELVSRSDQRDEIGTATYHGLLVDEQSGCLNPARYVRGLADAAARAGACIAAPAGVQRLEQVGKRWRVVTSAGGVVDTDHVLVATNGYTDRITPRIQRRLVPIGSYIVATEPLDSARASALLPKRRMAFDSKHFLYYFRLTDDSRLLFGGRAEFTRPDARSIARAADILQTGMTTVFPELRGVSIEYAWGGNVAFTRDQMPHAGRLGGMFFAGGYCGHGVAISTELGDLMARRISGEHVANPLLDLDCPAIPLYHGTPWFLPLVGAYYKVIDWIS